MTPTREPLSKMQQDAVQASIDQRAKELEEAFLDVIIQSAPVFQSADALKKSIDEILGAIDSDQFEHAAALGYREFCSNFVWMQRTLGGLNDAALQCSDAISTVAGDCGLAHEQVKPFVLEFFERIRGPRGKTQTDDQRTRKLDEMLDHLRHSQPPP